MALTKVSTGMLEAGAASVDLNLDDGTFYIDVANGRVGVGTTTPSTSLEVSGDTTLSSATVSGALGTNTLSVSSSATIDTLTVSTTATVPYDNTISGLTATNVQSAITELNTLLGGGNVGSQATWNIYEFTTTANQTSFDISTQGSPAPSYVPGYVQVYLNGILLGENDYTAVDGTTINFSPGITNAGQLLSVVVLDSFNTAELLRVTSIDASASTNSISIDSTDQVTLSSLNVTGTVTADGLTVDGDSTLDAVQLTTSSSFPATGFTLNSNGFSYEMVGAQGKIFRSASNTKELMRITNDNDVYFYEDTGTTAKFFWDASAETLSIGDPSADNVTIYSTDDVPRLEFEQGGTVYADIGHRGASASARQNIFEITTKQSEPMAFRTNNTERMRIDSSGNLLVGRISVGTTGTGHSIRGDDSAVFARAGGEAVIFSRSDSNGEILRFDSNGSSGVGSIGIFSDKFYFAGANEGIAIDDSLNAVIPVTDTGAGNNDAIDLGASGGPMFKDLYLSGRARAAGSTGFPAFASVTDTDTGMNPDGVGNIQFITQGSEAMRIDSSGNVIINKANFSSLPATSKLNIFGDGVTLRLDGSSQTTKTILFRQTSVTNPGEMYADGSLRLRTEDANTRITFHTNSSGSDNERMRIDASGNLLVGVTTTAAGNEGMVYFNGNSLRVTRDSNEPLNLDRLGSGGTENGSIVDFKSNGTTVGSIGIASGVSTYIHGGTGYSGLTFGNDEVLPCNESGANRDAEIDLGDPNGRFKDLYLSDRVIVGGGGSLENGEIEFVADSTRARIVGGYGAGGGGYLAFHTDTTGGTDLERARFNNAGNLAFTAGNGIDFSANSNATGMTSELLNDYEEGTWSPTVFFGGTAAAVTPNGINRYIKVGGLVFLNFQVDITNLNSGTGNIRIGNLPFPTSGSYEHGNVQWNSSWSLPAGYGSGMPFIEAQSTVRILIQNNTGHIDLNNTHWSNSSAILYGFLIYKS